jgi:hypothetical protein
MAAITIWQGGRLNSGFTWTNPTFAAGFQTMVNGNTCMGSADITNGTSLDQFADLSIRCTIASSTIAAGANITAWIYALLDNGTTYGDGQLASAGTSTAITPTFSACAIIPLVAAAAQTTLVGFAQQIVLPPGTFRFAVQNNSGFTFTAANCLFRSYNIRVDNAT